MTAGGIWAPLVGTFFLVLISLLVAAPVGVLAGVYLNEYARDNWLTRIINLARGQSGRRAEHRPCAVRGGGVRALLPHAPLAAGRFLHAGRDDPAGDHHQHPRGPGLGADVVPRGLLEPGGLALADHSHAGAAQLDQRHPHRRDPPGFAGRGRNRPHPLHRRRLLRAPTLPSTGLGDSLRGALHPPLHADDPGPRRLRRRPVRHRRGAGRTRAGGQQPVDRPAQFISARGRSGDRPWTPPSVSSMFP